MTDSPLLGGGLAGLHPVGLRPVRPGDRAAVEAIAAQVWDGEDYLPQVFDDWLADPEGLFWAATIHDRLIGLVKLTRMEAGEWWMEGLRVDPAYRRRGIGRILYRHVLSQARRYAPGVLRFSTASDNATIVRLAAETGFAQVASFVAYGAAADPTVAADGVGRLAVCAPSDLRRVLAYLEASPYYRTAEHMLEQNWRFLPLRERLLAERLAAGLVYGWWMADRLAGVAVLNPEPEEEDEADAPFIRKLYLGYLDAAPDQRAALAAALRGLAGARGDRRVSLKVAEDGAVIEALRAAGYERRWALSILLFARDLASLAGAPG